MPGCSCRRYRIAYTTGPFLATDRFLRRNNPFMHMRPSDQSDTGRWRRTARCWPVLLCALALARLPGLAAHLVYAAGVGSAAAHPGSQPGDGQQHESRLRLGSGRRRGGRLLPHPEGRACQAGRRHAHRGTHRHLSAQRLNDLRALEQRLGHAVRPLGGHAAIHSPHGPGPRDSGPQGFTVDVQVYKELENVVRPRAAR